MTSKCIIVSCVNIQFYEALKVSDIMIVTGCLVSSIINLFLVNVIWSMFRDSSVDWAKHGCTICEWQLATELWDFSLCRSARLSVKTH